MTQIRTGRAGRGRPANPGDCLSLETARFKPARPVALRHWLIALALVGAWHAATTFAQIDPVRRELFQVGYDQPLEGRSPIAGYAFFYYNQPQFYETNLTLRLAIAPVYLDSELGISHALGPNTDFAVGLAGGGFADDYDEIRQGKFYPEESFSGNGGQLSSSIYHLFDPGYRIPLNGVLRGEVAYSEYDRDNQTDQNFVLPPNETSFHVRTGFRLGGKEPLLAPDLALELSAWYEGMFRLNYGPYGYSGDREIEPDSHLFWGRALFAYTLPQRKDNFMVSVTAGTSADSDRFSAYRLGGVLPLASEFPLNIPGYYNQELSASRFMLWNAIYYLPLDARKHWELNVQGATALVDYVDGEYQPGHWNSGVGGGLTYHANSRAWLISLDYGYGIDAIRTSGRGASSVQLLIQFDLDRSRTEFNSPGPGSPWYRGLQGFLNTFQ
jgi:hypothetical protein